MKLFKKRRRANITWMTVKCDECEKKGKPCTMYVDREAIRVRPTGYKGGIQLYTTCSSCGKEIVIPEETVPKNIYTYIKINSYMEDKMFKG